MGKNFRIFFCVFLIFIFSFFDIFMIARPEALPRGVTSVLRHALRRGTRAVTVDLWDLRTQKPMRTRYLEVGRIEDGENMSDMSM